MTLPFELKMAWRESRGALGRFPLLVASISVGVAALVAIHSFSANLATSVHNEARSLLGADLAFRSSSPFPAPAEQILTEVGAPPGRVARVTRFASMAYVARTAGTRLVQVSAVEDGYPFYGHIGTDPPGAWEQMSRTGVALVDPSLLVALGAKVGDTLSVGQARLEIGGSIVDFPGDVGARGVLGPRVFIPARALVETGLIGFGSRVQYEAYVRLSSPEQAKTLAERYRPELSRERVQVRTVEENEEGLSRSLSNLGRYLGLVALLAVLLGGLGVGSAAHVFVKRRTESVAALRCLGASAGTVLRAYLLHVAGLALLGSVAGAVAGSALEMVLPRLFRGLLPVSVDPNPSWGPVLLGLGVGFLVATLFALLPLLEVRRISPLLIFRRSFEERATRRDPLRGAAAVLLAASVLALASLESKNLARGAWFTGGIAVTLGILALAAQGLMRALRSLSPRRAPYVFRQGLANLHRPTNQTVMVVLVMGFGTFLLCTLFLVQHNLLRDLRVGSGRERPNLALFDIQKDQHETVSRRLAAAGLPEDGPIPIVPMRISSLRGVPAASLLEAPPERSERPERGGPHVWAVRREYRSTYRDRLTAAERTAAGRFWDGGQGQKPGDAVPISMEKDLAHELGVGLGDEIVWDVEGLPVTTRVVHLRELSWARFEPNFFVVFPKGPLDEAPQTFVSLTRVGDPAARAGLERAIVEAFPNISILDLGQVQGAIEEVVSRVAAVVRFMAIFSLLTGGIVMVGAILASQYDRVRQAVLLKTLGATRRQILLVALTEYAALGALGCSLGLVTSLAAGFGLVHFVFDSPFYLPAGRLLGLVASLLLGMVAAGIVASLGFLVRPPLEALRSE
jgi:putative ABC transport system permease protein